MRQERASKLRELHGKLQEIQGELCRVQREGALGEVEDHAFLGPDGPVRLSDLFGERRDLVLVHNMGSHCAYCTMWADGLVGLVRHIETRAAFALVTPEAPEAQRAFAESRGWPFRIVSSRGSTLERLLGFEDARGSRMPGYSTFSRDEHGTIRHVASDFFGPGDSYNGAWHMFARLADGAGDWHPTI